MIPYSENSNEDETTLTSSLDQTDRGFARFENRQFIERIFNLIPASHRLVLTFYYYHELSYEEISLVTGWPMGTVKATLHRAKVGLRHAALEESHKDKTCGMLMSMKCREL